MSANATARQAAAVRNNILLIRFNASYIRPRHRFDTAYAEGRLIVYRYDFHSSRSGACFHHTNQTAAKLSQT